MKWKSWNWWIAETYRKHNSPSWFDQQLQCRHPQSLWQCHTKGSDSLHLQRCKYQLDKWCPVARENDKRCKTMQYWIKKLQYFVRKGHASFASVGGATCGWKKNYSIKKPDQQSQDNCYLLREAHGDKLVATPPVTAVGHWATFPLTPGMIEQVV